MEKGHKQAKKHTRKTTRGIKYATNHTRQQKQTTKDDRPRQRLGPNMKILNTMIDTTTSKEVTNKHTHTHTK